MIRRERMATTSMVGGVFRFRNGDVRAYHDAASLAGNKVGLAVAVES